MSTWMAALLLVMSVACADAYIDDGASAMDRFVFDVAWFLPALLFRSAYLLIRCRTPRPVDQADRYANSLDPLFVMACPAAIAVTGGTKSLLGVGLLFFAGSLFYAWIGGSDWRHPWSAVLVLGAAAVPMSLYRGEKALLFLGFVLVPSIVTSLLLGQQSRSTHAQLSDAWRDREEMYRVGIDSTTRENVHLNQVLVSLAGTHHDVANALTGALLSAAKLNGRRGPGDDEVAASSRDLERLQAQLLTMKGILETVRSLSREMDPSSLAPRAPASVEVGLSDACRWLSEAGIPLQVHLDLEPDGPLVRIKGGQLGLCRILHNLLLNSAQGDGQRGATRASVSVRRKGARTVITVSDNGPGFSESQLTAPIQVFQSTKQNGGTGLGLASVDFAVREGGGIVRRANGQSGGAVVSFDLETVSA